MSAGSADRTSRLRDADFFRDLPADVAATLLAQCRWSRHARGDLVARQGEPGDRVFFLVSGSVRVVLFSAAGRQMSYRDVEPGGIVAEFSAIDGRVRSASILAQSECELASLSSPVFLDTMLASPKAALMQMRRLVENIRSLTDRQIELATMPILSRVCAYLVREAQRRSRGQWVAVDLPTHQEIAHGIGGNREQVTRALNELRGRGLLRGDRQRVEVAPDGLKQLLELA